MKVVFFGKLREQVGTSVIDVIETPENIEGLLKVLKSKGDNWRQAFDDNDVLIAVNQTLCDSSQMLSFNDEVAFFPPVTGG
ncbi:MoaD/ThiS family protein [Aliiglaciecola sp.]|nr:MoaD/ThiS family protein [Aliiglaciecola sp.]